MKMIAVVLACLVTSFLSACASTGSTQTPAQVAAAVQAQISKACAVASPTLASLQAMSSQMTVDQQAALNKISAGAAELCTSNGAINTSSINAFVQTAMPAAIQAISQSSLSAQDKTTVEIGLLAFQTALSAALAQYAAPAVVAPASAALVA